MMNWISRLRRPILVISIFVSFVAGISLFIYGHIEVKKDFPSYLEKLNQYRSNLERDERIISNSSMLSEEERRKKDIDLPSLEKSVHKWKFEIAMTKQKLPPQIYYIITFNTLIFCILIFISTWVLYFMLKFSLIRIIIPPIRWIVHKSRLKNDL